MDLSRTFYAVAILCLSALSFHAHGQTAANPTVQSQQQIDERYKSDRQGCDGMSGNQKDVCQQKAKANREKAEADAKEGKRNAETRQEASKDKRDADYKVGKEKCDSLSGNAQDACVADLKTRYGK